MENNNHQMMVERAKELRCMYAVDEVLQNKQLTVPKAMEELVYIIPTGFTDSEACRVRITLNALVYAAADFGNADKGGSVPIMVGEAAIGSIEVGYICGLLQDPALLVLEDELRMLTAIANRISLLVLDTQRNLSILFDMLQRIDPDMLMRICEKLRVHLRHVAGSHGDVLFDEMGIDKPQSYGEVNTPMRRQSVADVLELGKKLISASLTFLSSDEVYALISEWIQDERSFSLVRKVDSKTSSISEILDAARNYTLAMDARSGRDTRIDTWLVVELAHRFLTNDEHLLNLVLDNLKIADLLPMIEKIIGAPSSTGNIGGKAAGLFIAKQILDHAGEQDPLLANIKAPRSWFMATDEIVSFLHYNHMEEYNAYKYHSIDYMRMTYDNVVTKIKNGRLPPHTLQMLGILLDDFEGKPLIVRSSSLLEDRQGSAFSGKYKSLFLVNQGPKQKRLEELVDAILEVFSSMYSPDAIQYRKEREMLNFTEQMGILIQEVVGCRVGPYFMPVFAGVAFSNNLLRWSTRVTREEGLVRMVMGLGTRAVDRVNDDYPVLFSPGRPGLRINQTPEDSKHYSPKHVDVINLETACFETLAVDTLLRQYGGEVPGLHKLVSVLEQDFLQAKSAFGLDYKKDDMVVTFEGILSASDIPAKLKRMLDVLSSKMQTPVDIEFAYDGESLYLLQCRPQGRGIFSEPASIPKNLPAQDVLFSANRFITNGRLDGITHIVYVDSEGYGNLSTREELLAVGTAVGLLNEKLPRRKFILMGPGRWGSRGDIQLGVRVTYSDISNTAALIEVAKEKRSYVPELSFGTHFFQDLVEANIVYIPLYPGQKDTVYKERFFLSAHNKLAELLPEYAYLEDALKVIDLPGSCQGKTLYIRLNAEQEQGVAFLTDEQRAAPASSVQYTGELSWKEEGRDEHWRWRHYMAEQIAKEMDMKVLGVKGLYLFGSTDTGEAGMGSDIDLLVLFEGSAEQKAQTERWLDGWSRALAKINFLRTGFEAEGLLDVHMVTREDIARGDSYAIKITSVAEPATLLREEA